MPRTYSEPFVPAQRHFPQAQSSSRSAERKMIMMPWRTGGKTGQASLMPIGRGRLRMRSRRSRRRRRKRSKRKWRSTRRWRSPPPHFRDALRRSFHPNEAGREMSASGRTPEAAVTPGRVVAGAQQPSLTTEAPVQLPSSRLTWFPHPLERPVLSTAGAGQRPGWIFRRKLLRQLPTCGKRPWREGREQQQQQKKKQGQISY